MLRARECTPTLFPFVVFTFGLAVESIKEFGGASILVFFKKKNLNQFDERIVGSN
jgi:hypothetical protein